MINPSTERHVESRMNPRNDDDPNCERTCVELRVYPKQRRFEDVSELLTLLPTLAGNVGETKVTDRGKEKLRPKTFWVLSSEPHVQSKDVRPHLDWLLRMLKGKETALTELAADDGTKLTITCIWWSATGTGGPTFWPEQLLGLGHLGVEFGCDIQFYGPPED